MINTIIIDDELKAIVLLRKHLKKYCPDINIVGEAQRTEQAICLIELHKPQLLFLDVKLAEGDAFDLLENIQIRNFHVIFVTAYSEFAIKAFRFSVTDYLLKPVNRDLLIQAIQKVKHLIDVSATASSSQTLRVPASNGITFINTMNIIRMEAEGAYTHIYLDDGQHLMSSHHLKQFEEHLDENLFVRIHRSHLINRNKIKSINDKNKLLLKMTDGFSIEVPRRNKADFLKIISSRF
jgi:two-component system, LytTR family, response regulator